MTPSPCCLSIRPQQDTPALVPACFGEITGIRVGVVGVSSPKKLRCFSPGVIRTPRHRPCIYLLPAQVSKKRGLHGVGGRVVSLKKCLPRCLPLSLVVGVVVGVVMSNPVV